VGVFEALFQAPSKLVQNGKDFEGGIIVAHGKKLDPSDRISDPKEALSFGNHKGASNNHELLKKLVEIYCAWLWTCCFTGYDGTDTRRFDGTNDHHKSKYHR
jgi:hypothetical protein